MKLINININKYFHMIPLWKSPIKLPVELPVDSNSRPSTAQPSTAEGYPWSYVFFEFAWDFFSARI